MKLLLVLALLGGGLWWYNSHYHGHLNLPDSLPVAGTPGNGEVVDVRDGSFPLPSELVGTYTKADGHTIVEYYSDTCSTCRLLAAPLHALAAQRPDIKVITIQVPEISVHCGGSHYASEAEFNAARDACNQQIATAKARIDEIQRQGICGAPYFVVFKPDGSQLVADECTRKPATHYVRQILGV